MMSNSKKNIIIYGSLGIEENMGDQAMFFSLLDYIRKYPNYNITFMDINHHKENDKYTFNIVNDIPLKHMIKEINKFLYIFYSILTFRKNYDEKSIQVAISEYKKADILFALNGFLLSSQMSFISCIGNLIKILYAKVNNIRLIFLPQSVGPFNYKGIQKIIFNYLFKKSMDYPETIYIRETYGMELLKGRELTNIQQAHDLVLSRRLNLHNKTFYHDRKEIDISEIYQINGDKDMLFNVNMRHLKYIKKNDLLNFYKEITLGYIKETGGKVYLFAHDYQTDRSLTDELYNQLSNNDNVIYIKELLTCYEIEKMLELFSIGLISRWHALVHSIRANLPVVILGWAEKYHETARIFNINEHLFDLRDNNQPKAVINKLLWVKSNREEIKLRLMKTHQDVIKNDLLEREGKKWLK